VGQNGLQTLARKVLLAFTFEQWNRACQNHKMVLKNSELEYAIYGFRSEG